LRGEALSRNKARQYQWFGKRVAAQSFFCSRPKALRQLGPTGTRLASKRKSSPLSDSQRMALIGSRDTKPELRLRRALWARGLRYQLHARDLPGCPDVVFSRRRIAIFVHGCFWHRHGCRPSNMEPKRNAIFWASKLDRNVARDQAATQALQEMGWLPLVVWECEPVEHAAARIAEALGDHRPTDPEGRCAQTTV
jgi:DNA mismatch endonuclease (patch repair protein)